MIESTVSVTLMAMLAILLLVAICNFLLFPINKFKGVCSIVIIILRVCSIVTTILGVCSIMTKMLGACSIATTIMGYAVSRQQFWGYAVL